MSPTLLTAAYVGATILFILSLGGLSSPESSRRGNLYGMVGMTIAVLATLLGAQVEPNGIPWIVGAMTVGAAIGLYAARVVKMTQMPELVALMHSLVGLAAMLVGYANFIDPAVSVGMTPAEKAIHEVEMYVGVLIGAVTFSGSVIAFGKLSAKISGKPMLLPGRHLLSDVLAASAVASVVGIQPQAMGQAVETFAGLEHALERVAEVGDVAFVNDSKATNIAAAGRAIESFDDKVVVIMGGRFKGGRFEDLREAIAARADAVVAIGEAAPLIHAALDGVAPVRDARSMAEAVRVGFALARPGGVVLLAPACSSFDMFRDYAERGTTFKNEVRRLAMDVSAHKH